MHLANKKTTKRVRVQCSGHVLGGSKGWHCQPVEGSASPLAKGLALPAQLSEGLALPAPASCKDRTLRPSSWLRWKHSRNFLVCKKTEKNVGRPVGRLRPKGERGGGAQSEANQRHLFRSLLKNTLFDKIENCKNYIGKSIGTIYRKPILICQWHLKLFFQWNRGKRDLFI